MALHAALFLSLLAAHYSPSLSATTPVLDVELVDVGATSHERGPPPPAPAAPTEPTDTAGAAQTAAGAGSQQPRLAGVMPEPPAPERLKRSAPPQVSAANRLAPPAAVDLSAVVADLARNVPAPQPAGLAPIAPKLPASPAEQRMLKRKLSDLAEHIARLDASRPQVSWTDHGRRYTATVTPIPAVGRMGIDEAVVEVSTERDGRRLSTRIRMRRLAFSSYAEFVNRWDPPDVQLHDDHIDGPFHSNSEISVVQDFGAAPIFDGKVTTARGLDISGSFGPVLRRAIFRGGLRTHVRRIELPDRYVPFPSGSAPAPNRVQRFREDTRIVFHDDGTFSWRPLDGSAAGFGPVRRRKLPSAPFYIMAAPGAEIDVSGVVNGKVLVYAPDKIVIVDDLTYAADPARYAGSDDYLGLVSDGNVEIADAATTGPGDLSVEAAIYAKRRFAVDRYGTKDRATLYLYGSVAAGALSATEPRFRTEMHFDRRLEHLRPPSFPMTDRYEVSGWDGQWTAEPNDSGPGAANTAPTGRITAASEN